MADDRQKNPKAPGRAHRTRPIANREARARAIDAAVRLIGQRGLDGAQAREIAVLAGISIGTLYNMFGGLDELIRRANGQTYDDLLLAAREALDKPGAAVTDGPERMRVLARTYLTFVTENPNRWSATIAFNQRQTASPPAWYRNKEEALWRLIDDAISGLPGAANPAHRRRISGALWGSVHGVISLWLAARLKKNNLEDVWSQIDLILRAVNRELADPATPDLAP